MNAEKLTQKSAEAIRSAQALPWNTAIPRLSRSTCSGPLLQTAGA